MNHCPFEVDIAGTRCPNNWEKNGQAKGGSVKEESCARAGSRTVTAFAMPNFVHERMCVYTKSIVGMTKRQYTCHK